MPAEVIKLAIFHISFPVNDPAVFVRGNRPLGFVFKFWPEPSGDDWPREPVHTETVIMQFAQQNVCADCARPHAGEQLFRLRLNDDQFVNQTKCRLPCAPFPAILGGSFFVFNDGIECVTLGPLCNS